MLLGTFLLPQSIQTLHMASLDMLQTISGPMNGVSAACFANKSAVSLYYILAIFYHLYPFMFC